MKMRMMMAVAVLVLVAGQALAQGTVWPGESTGMELTVYNGNMALVKDTRTLTLADGLNDVRFDSVAAAIDPTSVHFKSLTAPDSCVIREQNFQYDLVSRARLLEKYLNKEIVIRRELEGGGVQTIKGILLSAVDQLVIQTEKGLVITTADTVELPSLPDGLTVKPTLNWLLECTQAGKHSTELSYITNNINWTADYVAVVNAEDTKADINGWVTLDNKSGATYTNARLKLIAGDVRRVQPNMQGPGMRGPMGAGMKGAPPQFEEKTFFEYHMYTLGRPTTVRDNEMKQVELLTAAGIPVKKRFFFDGARTQRDEQGRAKAQVKMEFVNSAANNLGMPLPKGKVRVYKADADGSLQFVGEDLIDHTPKDETVRLYIGDAFDVVGEWQQTNQTQIAPNVNEFSYSIKMRNHKDTDIVVTVVEHSYGDWKITQSSHEASKRNATDFEFTVPVPKDGDTTITYTVRVTT